MHFFVWVPVRDVWRSAAAALQAGDKEPSRRAMDFVRCAGRRRRAVEAKRSGGRVRDHLHHHTPNDEDERHGGRRPGARAARRRIRRWTAVDSRARGPRERGAPRGRQGCRRGVRGAGQQGGVELSRLRVRGPRQPVGRRGQGQARGHPRPGALFRLDRPMRPGTRGESPRRDDRRPVAPRACAAGTARARSHLDARRDLPRSSFTPGAPGPRTPPEPLETRRRETET